MVVRGMVVRCVVTVKISPLDETSFHPDILRSITAGFLLRARAVWNGRSVSSVDKKIRATIEGDGVDVCAVTIRKRTHRHMALDI